MGNRLRRIALRLMGWLGLIRLFQFIHRHDVVILMIHGVMDDRDNPSWIPLRPQLSREKLEAHLEAISKRYHFVSLIDAVQMLQGHKPMEPYSVVLTFDDGYRNNMTHALPILREYDAPAAFFVPTGFLDHPRPFWFDRLDYALQQVDVEGRQVKIGACSMRLKAGRREDLSESYKNMRRTAKKQKMSDLDFLRDIEALSNELEHESGKSLAAIHQDDDWSMTLTWDQLHQLANDGVTIGSHTVDHRRLGLVKTDHAREQLTRSKQDIEVHTDRPCQALCYPNGSYTEEMVELARQCGYLCAVTTDEGLNHVGDDLMKLKRINMPTDAPSSDLIAEMCGISECLSRAKNGLVRWSRTITGSQGISHDEIGELQ